METDFVFEKIDFDFKKNDVVFVSLPELFLSFYFNMTQQ